MAAPETAIPSPPRRRPQLGPVPRRLTEVLFEAQQLIVLGDAVRAADRACLDLAGVGGHGNVGDGRVLGFAAAVADDRSEVVAPRQFDGVERLGQRADLVHLDQDAVARLFADAVSQAFGVGDEQVVADQLYLGAQLARQLLPAGPVVL